ncbi:hypothetical protein CYMTET_23412 [Cymbomonas tetramitiformis]|uniref:Uncharacterized protein n=1 Tax=Cymbomonas tetramitiformis TaxID=36881 RepID=A0AAE0FYJ3_9CHLO|nr:hypothetical protein CYMTET_23412 [Cymbomonas tetramitiformis]
MTDDRDVYSVYNGFGDARRRLDTELKMFVDETTVQLLTPWPTKAWIEELHGDLSLFMQRVISNLDLKNDSSNTERDIILEQLRYEIVKSSPIIVWDIFSTAVHGGLDKQVHSTMHMEQAVKRWQAVIKEFSRSTPRASGFRTPELLAIDANKRIALQAIELVVKERRELQRVARELEFASKDVERQSKIVATASEAATKKASLAPLRASPNADSAATSSSSRNVRILLTPTNPLVQHPQ